MTQQPEDNPQTPAPPDAEEDGFVKEKWNRVSCMADPDGATALISETAAERDRLIEDKENFEILINTLDGEVTRLKASNEVLVGVLERFVNNVSDGPILQELYREKARAALKGER